MAIEARRGCGYRKVGGLYMMGGQLSAHCCRLPIIMNICPCCGMGVRLTRTWTWLDPRQWLTEPCTGSALCSLSDPSGARLKVASDERVRVGLLNIGASFYPSPEAFLTECRTLGVSRRIQRVPRGFKIGEHTVWIAHPKVKQVPDTDEMDDGFIPGRTRWAGGIIASFRPDRIEKVMTVSQEAALTDEEREDLAKKGIIPFVVPDDDPDHLGSVYDKEEQEAV